MMGLWSEIVIGSIVLFFIIYMSFVDIKNNLPLNSFCVLGT